MLRKVRTYRSVYRFLAMTLLVTSVLSIIGHACLMDEAHAGPMIKKCCCKKAHTGHEGMETMMAGEACDEKKTSHGDHHDQLEQDDCCSTDFQAYSPDATPRIKVPPPERLPATDIVYTERIVTLPTSLNEGYFRDLGPPIILSPPAHILFAQFLN